MIRQFDMPFHFYVTINNSRTEVANMVHRENRPYFIFNKSILKKSKDN